MAWGLALEWALAMAWGQHLEFNTCFSSISAELPALQIGNEIRKERANNDVRRAMRHRGLR